MTQSPAAPWQRSVAASAVVVAVLTFATACVDMAPTAPAAPVTSATASAPSVFIVPDTPELGLHAVIREESVETAAEPGLAERFFGPLSLPRSEANEALVAQFVNRDCESVLPASAEIAVACDTEGELIYLLQPASVTAEQIAAVEAVRPRGGYPGAPDVLMLTLTHQGAAHINSIPGSDWRFVDGFNRIAVVVDGVVIAKPVYTQEIDGGTVLYFEARPPWHPGAMVRAFGTPDE